MLDSSKILAKPVSEASANVEMKAKEQHETLNNLIKQTLTNDPFLSFSKAEKSPVQWFHLLDTLDQQSMNQDLSSSKLELVLDAKGHRQEETENDSKAEEAPAFKNCSAKGGNLFVRGLQNSGDKFSSLRLPEAMVAIAQAAKDLPGWPLMSSKMTMHKCEKCSQEFSSPLNQQRHMRATHQRPLKGDKEDLKRKKEQIGIFWDKLIVECSMEILSSKNLSLGNLSATSLVEALSIQLQQPGLLSVPQSYIRVATLLLEIVQGKPSRYPLSSRELFVILEDASEDNLLYGVTSSSMQRCIFGSEPGRVGLETKNLVSSLGFLVELRLVQAWMDDKDAEALRCQNALVEEEEAAQKRQAKLQERKRQKKMRQRESKNKDKKALTSSVGLQEDSPTTSTASSGFSGTDTSPNESSEVALVDTGAANHSGFLEDEHLRYSDYQEDFESENASLDQRGDSARTFTQFRGANEYGMVGGRGWKDRKQGDYSYSSRHLKYGASNDRRGSEHQFGDQWLRKPHSTNGSSAQEFAKMNTCKYRERLPVMKRPISMTGSGQAVWTRKVLQTSDESLHDENGEATVSEMVPAVSETLIDAPGTAAGKLKENIWPAKLVKSEGWNQDSSPSHDSIISESSSSVSARTGFDDKENREGMSVAAETAIEGKVGSKALVIGSVTIPYGDPWYGNPAIAKAVRALEDTYQPGGGEMKCDELSQVVSTPAAHSAEGAQRLTKTAPVGTVREMPASWKDAPPYRPLSESSKQLKGHTSTLINKPGVVKIWRPITERSDTVAALSTGIVSAEDQEQGVTVVPMACREAGNEYAGSYTPLQSKSSMFGADKDSSDSSNTGPEGHKDETIHVSSAFISNKFFFEHLIQPPVQAGCDFEFLKGDIAGLLHQRWDDATSCADAVYYQDWGR